MSPQIQIVEDDHGLAEILIRAIKANLPDCEITHHATGMVVLTAYQQGYIPNFLILDINLEAAGIGYAVLSAANQLSPPPVVIITTSEDGTVHEAVAIMGGAKKYTKPYDPNLICFEISTHLSPGNQQSSQLELPGGYTLQDDKISLGNTPVIELGDTSAKILRELIGAYPNGMPIEKLSAAVGITPPQVSQYCQMAGQVIRSAKLPFEVKHRITGTGRSEYVLLEMESTRAGSDLLQITRKATRDSLTGLWNREYLDLAGEQSIATCMTQGEPASVMMMDIDDFKVANESYGHQAGDQALIGLANYLLNSLRAIDMVCRYGGDEFTVILPNTNAEVAETIANRLCKNTESIVVKNAPPGLVVNISIGVRNICTGDQGDISVWMGQADQALKIAKLGGKNAYGVWSPETITPFQD